jgi:hypothetical protein
MPGDGILHSDRRANLNFYDVWWLCFIVYVCVYVRGKPGLIQSLHCGLQVMSVLYVR